MEVIVVHQWSAFKVTLKLFHVANPGNSFTRPRFKAASGDEPKELKYDGVELANAKLSDEEKSGGKDDDMITLPHLHEPAILHAIGERFDEGKIYTWTGPVLIAVNPFQRLPLYTSVSTTLIVNCSFLVSCASRVWWIAAKNPFTIERLENFDFAPMIRRENSIKLPPRRPKLV